MKKLETIAKDCVLAKGEDLKYDIGNCVTISRCIVKQLEKNGLKYPFDIHIISPMLKERKGFAFGYHEAVILPKKRLIIDTQLWQLNKNTKPTDLQKRKVVFTYDEYKRKGLIW
jgi:hypothetical protein